MRRSGWLCRSWPAGLLLTLGPLLAEGQPAPQDYPQWRGLHRDGSASEFAMPEQWPDTLTLRWRVEVGEGYATPIIVGDRVYVFSRQDGHEVLTALETATGRIVWESGYPAPYEMFSGTAAHGEGPKATPLFHRGRVYTHGITGAVSAFDAKTGERAWHIPPPEVQPLFGTSVSPLAEGDHIILHPGYGPLTAFDAQSGETVWASGDQGVWASPIVTELDGVRQVVSVAYQYVEGVALTDGQLLWEYPINREMVHAVSPLVYHDTVLVTGQDSGVKALRPVRHGDTWDVELVWETADVAMDLSNPVLIEDTLFGLSHRSSGQFFALDARNGELRWLGEPRAAENTAVAKAGDLLFLLNDDAELIVATLGDAGLQPFRTYSVAESATWAQPVISGNRVFIKDVDTLALWTID